MVISLSPVWYGAPSAAPSLVPSFTSTHRSALVIPSNDQTQCRRTNRGPKTERDRNRKHREQTERAKQRAQEGDGEQSTVIHTHRKVHRPTDQCASKGQLTPDTMIMLCRCCCCSATCVFLRGPRTLFTTIGAPSLRLVASKPADARIVHRMTDRAALPHHHHKPQSAPGSIETSPVRVWRQTFGSAAMPAPGDGVLSRP